MNELVLVDLIAGKQKLAFYTDNLLTFLASACSDSSAIEFLQGVQRVEFIAVPQQQKNVGKILLNDF